MTVRIGPAGVPVPVARSATGMAHVDHAAGGRPPARVRPLPAGAGLSVEDEVARRETISALIGDELEALARSELAAGRRVPNREEETSARQLVLDALFGAGALERLLADPGVENITVNGADRVWFDYADGTRRRGPAVAGSDAELVELVRTAGRPRGCGGAALRPGQPRLNVQLPDGSRLFAVMAVTGRVSLSIRRHRFTRVTMHGAGAAGRV